MRLFIKLILSFLVIADVSGSHLNKIDDLKYQIIIESGTNQILNRIKSNAHIDQVAKMKIGDIVTWVALQLLNSQYSYYLLDKKTPEYLYISLDKTDCMLFVEEVIVLSKLIKANKLGLLEYIDGVKKIRYHGDVSYCNRNHYFKDWAISNEKRRIIEDIALKLTGDTLSSSAHILSYTIAKDKNNMHYANLACIKERETIVDNEKIGFIPIHKISKYMQQIKSGDIIGVVARNPIKSDAIRHVGIAYVKGNNLSYINASSLKSKVVIYDNLVDYLTKHKDVGIIVLRVKM